MIKSYFITAIRNLLKNRISSLINISGLAIGISSALVIYLLVRHDFSFDKFHKEGENIYRVVSSTSLPGLSEGFYYRAAVPSTMGNVVRDKTTGLDKVSLFTMWGNSTKVSVPGQSAVSVFRKQKDIIYADEHYFNLFNYRWLVGSPGTSLRQPNQVVLAESNANLYFPGLSPGETIGREIIFNDTMHMFVSGIVEDFKQNTDFTFKTFISNVSLENETSNGNKDLASQLFIKLAPGSTTAQIQTQITALFKKYDPDLGNKVISFYELQVDDM